ncbi:MAG: Flp pilus assembly complex ATPase component TadA [Lentisphaeria bacterium]|nr:Flp pilus assembly complex ATPase component TadA [Lentisphaeria bacterium]
MYYNLFLILILLGWIFTGVYTLDFIEERSGENEKGRRWLNLAALFFGPVALLCFWLSQQFARRGDGDVSPAQAFSGRAKKSRNAPAFELAGRGGEPVVPVDGKAASVEAMTLAYSLIEDALGRKADRVMVYPDEEGEYNVFFRIGGADEKVTHLGCLPGGSLVTAFKHASGMVIGERRSSQNGGFFARDGKSAVSCFVTSARAAAGEQLMIRLGLLTQVPPLEGLGIPAGGLAELRALLEGGNGLVLLLGRPGSGRTTTMYAILQSAELVGRRIVTFENPIEIKLDNAMQLELDPYGGKTLLKLMGDAINDGADTLAIGALSDPESARLAVNFARNGHLVIAQLDCATPLEAFSKFEKWELTPRMFGGTPLCMLSQALARKSGGGLAVVFDLPDRTALDSVLETKGVTIDMVRQAIGGGGDGGGLLDGLESLVNEGTISREEAARVMKTVTRKGE